jgi:hypothetical protein
MLAHCGASTTATEVLNSTGYQTLNAMTLGDVYWRDADRKARLGTEHSMYTSSDKIQTYLEGNKIRTQHDSGFTSPYVFTQDGTPTSGNSAQSINVSFSGYKDTGFTYKADTGTYAVSAFGEPYMDDNTDTQVEVTNVIIIPTTQSTKADGQLQEFDLSSGTGYYACGGKYIEINWSKGDMYSALTFTNKDGTPLELGVGKTYICICGTDRPITFN